MRSLQGQPLSELQQQQPAQQQRQQQEQQQQQPGGGRLSGVDMGAYVQALHHRLAAAEEQAAQARQHGERQAHTFEARITLLEGRLIFVEGEHHLVCFLSCLLLTSLSAVVYATTDTSI